MANPPEERAEILIFCSDNGSGFDPTGEENAYYACQFAERHPEIKAIAMISYGAGESTLNWEIERSWSQHRAQLPGLRLGQKFLGGRREPTGNSN